MSDIPPLQTDPPASQLSAYSIGSAARSLLKLACLGEVRGVISRGIFVHLPPNRMIFLSYEPFRGPLTINIDPRAGRLTQIEAGDPVSIHAGRLRFPAPNPTISTMEARVWQAKPTLYNGEPFEDIAARLNAVITAVRERKNGAGLIRYTSRRQESPGISYASPDYPGLPGLLEECMNAARSGLHSGLERACEKFLGLGIGLTPSGDDFIIGVMLALSSFRSHIEASQSEAFTRSLIDAAYAITTTLSANLIECAAAGQADERLIAAMDAIISGHPAVERCVEGLCSWGNSSGADALLGMSLIIGASQSWPAITLGEAAT
ncbi:MAG: DUF2877 domain-containing protein [Chloroflexi bacterium]|nr:DUF2877 domain-containing protein [Chloroflexota bacterium]